MGPLRLTKWEPSFANSLAQASPMPADAPVLFSLWREKVKQEFDSFEREQSSETYTNTTFPSSLPIVYCLLRMYW